MFDKCELFTLIWLMEYEDIRDLCLLRPAFPLGCWLWGGRALATCLLCSVQVHGGGQGDQQPRGQLQGQVLSV